ncbi:MAG: hypothetical protein IPL78_29850 [Chloroflexi bacterium]|nr:hypothetical protein [Chloroflexota bacterium]
MMDHLSFRLPEAFVDGYKDKHIEWGFDIGGGNSLSELTYITKYSMKREDGSKERWHETCERVINGMFSILKDHAKMNGTYWNGNQAMYSAKEAYDRMFYFKWTPPGRGIENMGKAIVNKERNSAQLFNCSFISTEKLSTASVSLATRPFVLLMEQSLNGIGVGYDTLGAGKINLSSPRIDPDTNEYTIEDTREAWAASLGQLLECFFFPGRSLIRFDYSQLRAAGTPLKRAGGTASGPEPLIRMHEKIVELLINRDGEAITDMDIMDICNLAAKAVVSGGSDVLPF